VVFISQTGRLLRQLVRLSCRYPALTVALSVLLGALGLWYTLHELSFRTSGRDLLPEQAGYVVRYTEYKKEFGELEDIVVVIEARSLEAAKAYASRLVRELKASPVTFNRVTYRIDPKRFEGRQLLYLSTEELREIRDRIFDHQEFMENFAGDPGLAQLVEQTSRQIASSFLTHLFDLGLTNDGPVDTRFLHVLFTEISDRLDRPTPYRSPWGALFSFGSEDADAGYFFSEDKSLLFVLVGTPESEKGSFVGDQKAIDAVRGAIARLRPAFPTIEAGVTGAPTLSNDEMTSAFRDSRTATLLAFALTLLVMILAFRQVGKPFLMLAVLAVSLAWSMGVVTLTVGHLTIFSVMFISIVVGIGIDYGIYFLFRYEEEIFLGRNLKEAVDVTARRTGPGILLGALTAGGTFYVLMLTDFRGIREFGFIAGTAILLAWLSMMTFFPALLVLVDRHHAARPHGQKPRAIELARIHVPVLEWLTSYPKSVLVVAGIVTLASTLSFRSVGFDYNLLNLQAKGTESVVWEKKILAKAGRSGFSALTSAGSLEELKKKQEAFDQLPSVSGVDSILHLIPEDQEEKIKIIKSFAKLAAPVRIGRGSPVDLDRLTAAVRDLKRRLDVAMGEAGQRVPKEIKEIQKLAGQLLTKLERTDRESAEPALTYLQAQLYRDFTGKFHSLQRNLDPRVVTTQDVPDELRRKFVGSSGRFLLQVHPKVNIWDRAGAEQFVRELRSVDPDVTGPPVITYEAITLMEKAYFQGTAYAFLLVGALTLLMIRRIQESLLAILPLAVGMLWTIGLMRIFDLKFTLANVWGLPLIIGTSAEFGLNVVIRYMEGREHGGPLVARSTVMAVALNGLTTMVGFGSLMIADHQGIFGLGLLLTIGAASGLLASLVVLPVILRIVGRRERAAIAAPDSIQRPPAA
jgi:hopanoid biosynthesis associated RND transporter like protein HpnN